MSEPQQHKDKHVQRGRGRDKEGRESGQGLHLLTIYVINKIEKHS